MISIIDYSLVQYHGISISIKDIIVLAISFTVTRLALFFVRKLYKRRARNKQVDYNLHYNSLYQLIMYVVWVIYTYSMLSFIGFDLTLFLAGSAALFVGIGFGLQQTFNDFVSGIIILFEGTIRVGDIVELDGRVVKVLEIKLRTSRVITRDDIVMIIPNHKIIEDSVVNWSHSIDLSRFSVIVNVAYTSDPRLVERILLDIADQHPDVIHNEEYKSLVRFKNFSESSLEFHLLFISTNAFRIEATKSELRYMIMDEFKKEGVKMPFPQRDIHIIPPATV